MSAKNIVLPTSKSFDSPFSGLDGKYAWTANDLAGVFVRLLGFLVDDERLVGVQTVALLDADGRVDLGVEDLVARADAVLDAAVLAFDAQILVVLCSETPESHEFASHQEELLEEPEFESVLLVEENKRRGCRRGLTRLEPVFR